MKYLCLILNSDYQPFDIWTWQHAITKLLCTNSVRPIYDENGIVKYDKLIRDGKGNEYELPAVLVLTEFVYRHTGMAPYTKLNIYARDQNICQYCGINVDYNNRTIDHVIPRSHYNPKRYHFKLSSFENVVTCCYSCNRKKRNRTPIKADMKLIRKPKRISRTEAYRLKLALLKDKPTQWIPYLKVEYAEKT